MSTLELQGSEGSKILTVGQPVKVDLEILKSRPDVRPEDIAILKTYLKRRPILFEGAEGEVYRLRVCRRSKVLKDHVVRLSQDDVYLAVTQAA